MMLEFQRCRVKDKSRVMRRLEESPQRVKVRSIALAGGGRGDGFPWN